MKAQITLLMLCSLIVSLLAACGSRDDTANTASTQEKAQRNPIVLSADGVGSINASTPFNMHQITRAFQDYSVTEYTQFQKGDSAPVIRISEDGKPLILINPDTDQTGVFSVFVMSNKIGNALGHPIGTPYNKVYNYDSVEPCIAGTEEFTGKVLCLAPGVKNILYVFAGKWDGPKDEVPPAAILSDWTLDTIVWKPAS